MNANLSPSYSDRVVRVVYHLKLGEDSKLIIGIIIIKIIIPRVGSLLELWFKLGISKLWISESEAEKF